MAVKKYKPVTAGTRWRIGNAYAEVTTNEPEKSLLETKKSTGGRNSSGHMTMRYIGGGHKKKYRVIDFRREKKDSIATVKTIEYDPNRTCFIAFFFNFNYASTSSSEKIFAAPSVKINTSAFTISCVFISLKRIPLTPGTFLKLR